MVIEDRFNQKMPVAYSELLCELEWQFGIMLLTDILWHIIHRIPGCKTVVGVPQEASRVMYDEHEIDEYYSRLEAMITGVPAEIMYNVNEVGFDSWVDASRIAVVVPAEYTGSEIAVPVSRGDSRASVIDCMVANGRHVKPYAVVLRKTLEVELYELGIPPESCRVVHQENEFVTSQLFKDWLENVLVSNVIAQIQKLG
jgi:hypothetical protein